MVAPPFALDFFPKVIPATEVHDESTMSDLTQKAVVLGCCCYRFSSRFRRRREFVYKFIFLRVGVGNINSVRFRKREKMDRIMF